MNTVRNKMMEAIALRSFRSPKHRNDESEGRGIDRLPYEPMSKEEADTLVNIEKMIDEDVKWEASGVNMTLRAEVTALDGTKLRVHGVFHKDHPDDYRFSLVYRNEQVIRRWDVNRHHNPDCHNTDGPHKHYWTREASDSFAYLTTEIPLDDVNLAFLAFLRECKIHLGGRYAQVLSVSPNPPKQRQKSDSPLEGFDAKL